MAAARPRRFPPFMNRWLRLGLLLLSLLLFGFILWRAGPETWQIVLRGRFSYFFLAFLMHGLAGVASASRLQRLAQAVTGQTMISWRRMYVLNWTARALGLILPRSVSIFGGKTVALKAVGVPLRQAVWLVFVDNAFDLLLLGFWLIPAFLWFQGTTPLLFWLVLAGMTLVVGTLIWWGTQPNRLEPFLRQLRRFPRLAQRLNLDENSFIPGPPHALAALAWTVLLNLALITNYYFIGQAIDLDAAAPLITSSYPFVQLSLVVAIAPAGLGLFDLGWLGLLRLGGIPEADVLAFVVAQRAYIYLFVLAWTLFSVALSWTDKSGLRTEP